MKSQDLMADLLRSVQIEGHSPLKSLALQPEPIRKRFLENLTDSEAAWLRWCWEARARPEQLEPDWDWDVWLVRTGRGWGKTRTGAELVRKRVGLGLARRIAFVGRTAADVRDVMVEGESGILAVSPPAERPEYEPSKRRLTWPNGAVATTYSADEPKNLRGPQHDFAWADELAAWRYEDAWTQLMLGLRIGDKNAQCIVTTTPRPTRLIRDLIRDPCTHNTTGSTFDNIENVVPTFIKRVVRRYEGTTLGRQELHGEVLGEIPGTLWARSTIEKNRVHTHPELVRIVVGIDPAGSSKEDNSETGIIVGGKGQDGHGYILEDVSGHYSPEGWARAAIDAYRRHNADRIVAETNQGGEMVESVLRNVDKSIPYRGVHASRGKRTRAEPIAALDEQGKVHHVGMLAELEDQMCSWMATSGEKSPDRIDARVWVLTDLLENQSVMVAPSLDAMEMTR